MTNPDAALSLTPSTADGFTVLRVAGVLDATTREQFAEGLAGIPGDLILDLSGVTFMDSRALGLIVHRWQTSLTADVKFALVGVRYSTAKVMWITGLAERLPLYDSLEAALASA
ncbi:STAS domain-containing protein [Thermoactinospora rubra]|uniref:STAS domain-containing protein n=1 Tax=Thermoactinospora rubra TaxID=1088767 RepID=UPI000A10D9ED|nr:STAS domain-containing protein [Thermoactinospora rubra]